MAPWRKAFRALKQMDWSNRIGFARTHVREWLRHSPRIGRKAPNVMLTCLASGQQFRLLDRLGEKPLVLVFGSFTCPPFRHMASSAITQLYAEYRDDADFLTVYLKEAHAESEWPMPVRSRSAEEQKIKDEDGTCYVQPKTLDGRMDIARDFVAWGENPLPIAIDGISNEACRRYAAFPSRIYVISPAGRICYRGGRGPFEFNPKELETWLEQNATKSSSA